MNKKFFTLIAGVLMLAGTVGNAITIPKGKIAALEPGKKYQIALTTIAYFEDLPGTMTAPTPAIAGSSGTYKQWLSTPGRSTDAANATAVYNMLLGSNTLGGINIKDENGAVKAISDNLPLWYAVIDENGFLKGSPWNSFDKKFYESIFCLTIGNTTSTGPAPVNLYSFAHGFQLLANSSAADPHAYSSDPRPDNNPPSAWYNSPANVALNAGSGNLSDWAYSNTYFSLPGQPAKNQHWMPLYVFDPNRQTRDSVFTFIADADARNGFRLTKTSIENIQSGNLHPATILFEFVQPAPQVLSADDYNSKMGTDGARATKGRLLAFGPGNENKPNYIRKDLTLPEEPAIDWMVNEWKDKVKTAPWAYINMIAENVAPITTTNTAGTGANAGGTGGANIPDRISDPTFKAQNSGNWLYFKVVDDEKYKDFDDWGDINGKYLHVDTNYYGVLNSEQLTFRFGTIQDGIRANTKYVTSLFPEIASPTPSNPTRKIKYEGGKLHSEFFPSVGAPYFVSDFINQYRFQATYFWYNDSLAIDVLEANMKPRIWQGTKEDATATALNPNQSWYQYQAIFWTPPHYEWANIDGRQASKNGGFAIKPDFTYNTITPGLEYPDNYQANLKFQVDKLTGTKATEGDYLHLKLHDLENQSKVLSIGSRAIGTTITLNLPSCDGSAETSIAEGVYLIRNTTGDKYLTVPIHYGTYNSASSAAWLTLKMDGKAGNDTYVDINPERVPAYHWIVKLVDPAHPSKSPINIINREYPNIQLKNVKLVVDKEGIALVGYGSNVEDQWNVDGTDYVNKVNSQTSGDTRSFIKLTGDAVTNPYLGYYHKPDVTGNTEQKFELNYYNWSFESEIQTYFLNKGSDKDSSLRVNRARTLQFRFIPTGGASNYGYTPTDATKEGVQLKRVSYRLETDAFDEKLGPVTRQLFQNTAHRYALNYNFWSGNAFLFKTHNYALSADAKDEDDKTDFYAIIEILGSNFNGRLNILNDALWAFNNTNGSVVTSTFAITQYTPPLYRRFDGYDKYAYNATDDATKTTAEPFKGIEGSSEEYKENGKGAGNNGPLFLKFFNYIIPNSYLYENSPSKATSEKPANPYRSELKNPNISFLGTQNIIEFPEHLKADKEKEYVISYTFYVDPAFSSRKTDGTITNDRDEMTPKPQYMLALRPTVYKKGKICVTEGYDEWDGEGTPPNPSDPNWGQWDCNVEAPAMTIADYLFNAQDSIYAGNKDYEGKNADKIANTIRLAFVKGVHMGDTFYVLTGTSYANWTPAKIRISMSDKYKDEEKPLYNLPVFYKHYLGENTHYTPRYSNLSDEQIQKLITKAKSKITKPGSEFNSFFSGNGKSMVFQFRLANIYGAPNKERVFYIESQTADAQYGPNYAKFVQEINSGALVINNMFTSFQDPQYDYAPIGLQVTQNGIDLKSGQTISEHDQASGNETVAGNGVKVIGSEGAVTILNAAGKTVSVTNVLGQTIIKTVIPSDNASISLPKGIAVVVIEGESFKSVVK